MTKNPLVLLEKTEDVKHRDVHYWIQSNHVGSVEESLLHQYIYSTVHPHPHIMKLGLCIWSLAEYIFSNDGPLWRGDGHLKASRYWVTFPLWWKENSLMQVHLCGPMTSAEVVTRRLLEPQATFNLHAELLCFPPLVSCWWFAIRTRWGKIRDSIKNC